MSIYIKFENRHGIGAGVYEGIYPINIIGYNPAAGTGSAIVASVDNTFPTSVTTTKISSSSANDTAAGTGARTVLIKGLDANYNSISETATLNGQTGVTLVNQYLRVNDIIIVTVGSGLKNAGTIYVGTGSITSGVPAVVINSVAVGDNIDRTAAYSTAINEQLLLNDFYMQGVVLDGILGTAKPVTFTIKITDIATGIVKRLYTAQCIGNPLAPEFDPAILVLPAHDVVVTTTSAAASTNASVVINAYSVK